MLLYVLFMPWFRYGIAALLSAATLFRVVRTKGFVVSLAYIIGFFSVIQSGRSIDVMVMEQMIVGCCRIYRVAMCTTWLN